MLVVDDKAGNRDMLRRALEKECWQVREAEQGGMGPIEKGGLGREPLPAQLREQVAAAGPKAS